ncbi:helix-turn-helix domain-containing protein [Metamycoplasma auris]|uniref:Helix-turn-helix protein n=1 Tax=Metamycoplasma auris TaxID=51363 RepID=A0A2W7FXJ9_9BACT|nr:helix-turn-helix transcriptional regulator [Metamycoplasma auris]PZV98716.1 helix-turn-helix protein [Metamycoplasma auris]
MELKHICDLTHIHLHGSNFGEEILYYLNKFSMSQKELAQRLGLSTQYIYIIINSKKNLNLSIGIIEGLENIFNLELGTLAEVYSIYNNKDKVESEDIDQLLIDYGHDFIIENPSLPLISNIKLSKDMPISKKLMIMNRFYGVADLKNYYSYLKENALADEDVYASPNSRVWIRFCEISSLKTLKNKKVGVFRKNSFDSIFKKVLKIICSQEKSFDEKIISLKSYLLTKGIILITMPFIEHCDIGAITFQKGAQRLIFVSDIYNCEAFIFNCILHELTHCFFTKKNEDEINNIYTKKYIEAKEELTFKYEGIEDAINSIIECNKISHNDEKGQVCEIAKKVFKKYKKVFF